MPSRPVERCLNGFANIYVLHRLVFMTYNVCFSSSVSWKLEPLLTLIDRDGSWLQSLWERLLDSILGDRTSLHAAPWHATSSLLYVQLLSRALNTYIIIITVVVGYAKLQYYSIYMAPNTSSH